MGYTNLAKIAGKTVTRSSRRTIKPSRSTPTASRKNAKTPQTPHEPAPIHYHNNTQSNWKGELAGGFVKGGAAAVAYGVARNDLLTLFGSVADGVGAGAAALAHGAGDSLSYLEDEIANLMEGAKNVGTTAFGQAGGNLITLLVIGGTVYVGYEVYRFMT